MLLYSRINLLATCARNNSADGGHFLLRFSRPNTTHSMCGYPDKNDLHSPKLQA